MYGFRLVLSRCVAIAFWALTSYTLFASISVGYENSASATISEPVLLIQQPVRVVGDAVFENPARTLILEPGTQFGWHVQLDNPVHAVTLTEEFILPAPAATWRVPNPTQVSADGCVATTSTTIAAGVHNIGRGWVVTEGDPVGPYQMRIYLDGELVHTFEFDAVSP